MWAQVDGACQPVEVDDAAAGRLEITTCAEGPVTCGVTAVVSDTFVPTATWCRRDRDLLSGPAAPVDVNLRLVDVTHDHAVYTRIVQLTVVPVGLRGESQRCSSKKLGERVCFTADRFDVVELRGQPTGVTLLDSAPTEPAEGRSDCKQPCPSAPEIDDFLAQSAYLAARWFLPPDPAGVDLFRTPAACAAATATPPSVLPTDLCATSGARLR